MLADVALFVASIVLSGSMNSGWHRYNIKLLLNPLFPHEIFYFWLLMLALFTLVPVLALCSYTSPSNHLWFSNTLFDLDFCPKESDFTRVPAIDHCDSENGVTTQEWHKANVGAVFLIYFFTSLLLWIFYARNGYYVFNFFMRGMSLRECEYVTIEERVIEKLPKKKADTNKSKGRDSPSRINSGRTQESSARATSDESDTQIGTSNAWMRLPWNAPEEKQISKVIVANCRVEVEDINGVTFRHFNYQSTRYMYDHTMAMFLPPKNEVVEKNTLAAMHAYKHEPLSEDACTQDLLYRGRNEINVEVAPLPYFIRDEMLKVMNIWQLWQGLALSVHYQVIAGGLAAGFALLQVVLSGIALKRAAEKIRGTAKIAVHEVNVYRDEKPDELLEFGKPIDMSRMDLRRRLKAMESNLSRIDEDSSIGAYSDFSDHDTRNKTERIRKEENALARLSRQKAKNKQRQTLLGDGKKKSRVSARSGESTSAGLPDEDGDFDDLETTESAKSRRQARNPGDTGLKNGVFKRILSSDIVPGDVMEVNENTTMPADCVVLEGLVLVNEGDLTGEPQPVAKFPIERYGNRATRECLNFEKQAKRNILFAGTTVVQSLGSAKEKNLKAVVLVVQTGTATKKGDLIRKILFPGKIPYAFADQLHPLIFTTIVCLQLVSTLPLLVTGYSANEFSHVMVMSLFECLGMATQIASPLLLLGLVQAQFYASDRLRESKEKCNTLAPDRLLMAGEMKVQCLDKTGTITVEGLELYGMRPVHKVIARADPAVPAQNAQTVQSYVEFGPLVDVRGTKHQHLDKNNLFEVAMATCHTVTKIDNKLYGNAVEKEMVKFLNVDFSARVGEGVEYYRTKHASGGELLFTTVREAVPKLRNLRARVKFARGVVAMNGP